MKTKTQSNRFGSRLTTALAATCIALLAHARELAATTAAEFLTASEPPVFREGHTLPPLTRWGWSLPFEARVALADRWGYALEFGGYATTTAVQRLDDPTSTESRICALAASDPARYPLCVLLHRPLIDPTFINARPAETWCHDAGGNLITNVPQWKRYSPEMPASVYHDAAAGSTGTLARILQVCPIAVVLNGGEYGLSVYGHSGTTWAQDPAVAAARGARTWFDYISERKAQLETHISAAVRARVPARNLYLFYTTGGAPLRSSAPGSGWWTWVWDYAWFRPISDLPNSSQYYRDFNSGWSGNQDLLSCALNSAAQEIAQGSPLSYNWVCGGYRDGAFSEPDRYLGFLKCNYTAGMIGGIAGYFSYPPGGFGAAFGEIPPHWLSQMMALGHCHALFSTLEDFLRNGDLLPGPNPHRWSADLPAGEFPTGDPDLRVLARRHRDRAAWILTAWAAAGEARDAVVTIPDLGEVTLLARPGGSVYRARRTDDGPSLRLLDPDPLHPSRNLRTLLLAHPATGSMRYTNTNRVDIASLPMMDGYDGYRITTDDEEPADGWLPYDPDLFPEDLTAEFPEPAGEGPVRLYAWFHDSRPDDPLPTTAVVGEIVFTRTAPLPLARAQHTCHRLGGQSVIVPAADIDAGSTGGAYEGDPLAIHRTWLTLTDGPAPDLLTDDDTRVMVSETGTYTLVLSVMNEAGNRADAAACRLDVGDLLYGGGAFVWTGARDADWFNRWNWDRETVPIDGSEVTIPAGTEIRIDAPTAALASFAMAGGTVVFSNWWARLEADEMTLSGGTLRPAAAFLESEMSNRVWIVCSNLTVGSGAVIHADALGYAGRMAAEGQGPGKSVVGVYRTGGAGHGGRGGWGASELMAPGEAYGDSVEPATPGSSSAGRTQSGNQKAGKNGGGAFRIDAAGDIELAGRISADGAGYDTYIGGGAGGGIRIRCRTIRGNGTLRAAGGDARTGGGEGGGGRIALHYDPEEQAQIPLPALTFCVSAGRRDHHTESGFGTLSFSDSRWFTESLSNLRGWCHVPGFTNWAPASLTLTDSFAGFTAAGFQLAVGGAVGGSGDRMLGFLSNATVSAGGDLDASLTFEQGGSCRAGGNLRIPVTSRNNYHSRTIGCAVAAGSDLTLEGVWRCTSAPTNGTSDHGALLDAGGRLGLGPTGRLFLFSDQTAGASALLRAESLAVATGAVISADGGGFGGVLNADGLGPGRGKRHNTRGGGGGYGGSGGVGNALASPMGAAGVSNGLAYAPLGPGSSGGGRGPTGAQPGDPGGGLVRIEARGEVTINGTISACGLNLQSYGGAGSGGAIFIRAGHFAGGPNGILRADGGAYGTQYGGPGGGGRVAVWHGEIGKQAAALLQAGDPAALGPRLAVTSRIDGFAGTATAAKGAGTDTGQRDGTVVFLTVRQTGTLLLVR